MDILTAPRTVHVLRQSVTATVVTAICAAIVFGAYEIKEAMVNRPIQMDYFIADTIQQVCINGVAYEFGYSDENRQPGGAKVLRVVREPIGQLKYGFGENGTPSCFGYKAVALNG